MPKQNDFKHDYEATLEDAIRFLRRVKRVTDPLRYTASIHGSTVLRGKGHDVDVSVQSAGPEPHHSAHRVAQLILKQHCHRLHHYEEKEYEKTMSDIYMIFVTRDQLFIDLHIKGWA